MWLILPLPSCCLENRVAQVTQVNKYQCQTSSITNASLISLCINMSQVLTENPNSVLNTLTERKNKVNPEM